MLHGYNRESRWEERGFYDGEKAMVIEYPSGCAAVRIDDIAGEERCARSLGLLSGETEQQLPLSRRLQ